MTRRVEWRVDVSAPGACGLGCAPFIYDALSAEKVRGFCSGADPELTASTGWELWENGVREIRHVGPRRPFYPGSGQQVPPAVSSLRTSARHVSEHKQDP